ncbi:MAG TPA: diacylglycerol kinase [Methylophaga sp.]|nr:diacylglycerol kinase [Methylophaga sp.]
MNCLIVELLSSEIECISDRIDYGWDPLMKRAKDYGSLAVFISLRIATTVWLVIILKEPGL